MGIKNEHYREHKGGTIMFNRKGIRFYAGILITGFVAVIMTYQMGFAHELQWRDYGRLGSISEPGGGLAKFNKEQSQALKDETGCLALRSGSGFSQRDAKPSLTRGAGKVFWGNAGEPTRERFVNKDFAGIDYRKNLLDNIEAGTATAGDFIRAIKEGVCSLEDISPSSVANYMEALANKGLLMLIPSQYFNDEEVQVSLDVVFEDRSNIFANWNVFENQWLPSKM
jgi:hypothetical protein